MSRIVLVDSSASLLTLRFLIQIGIMLGLWVFLIFLSILGVERLKGSGATKSVLLFHRSNEKTSPKDEEHGNVSVQPPMEKRSSEKVSETSPAVDKSTTVFTWSQLDYTGESFQTLSPVVFFPFCVSSLTASPLSL